MKTLLFYNRLKEMMLTLVCIMLYGIVFTVGTHTFVYINWADAYHVGCMFLVMSSPIVLTVHMIMYFLEIK